MCILSIIIPFANFGRGFIFVDDNTRPHCVQLELDSPTTSYCCGHHGLLTAIVLYVWDKLTRQLQQRLHSPTTLEELGNVLQEEWERISQNFINNLVQGGPRRCLCPRIN
ncbi:hypothetical protein ILUMI_21839 [Ignelater luminosus]|uniref:Uncharacterized protein n=1 Tax=Ignelater luminosus TaxID=2038154 RepID=A0A8K0CI64_IGNLU|nr:hypothetical protein ILUMI_21839 [Ignelater luminosus]